VSLLRDALMEAARERHTSPHASTVILRDSPPHELPRTPTPARRAIDRGTTRDLGPSSLEAQQYANLCTLILLALRGSTSRVVVVTSATPGEGKSVTATNLAVSIARQAENRVVLVDADLRAPCVDRLLGVPNLPGLADYLGDTAALPDVLRPSPVEGLVVLPAGRPTTSPTLLLTSPRLSSLVTALRERFADIIIDSGPVLSLADPHVLASLADGVLLVVRAGRTRREIARDAIQRLHGSRILGLVLNSVNRGDLEASQFYERPGQPEPR
jgi:protein-tyrosine kinase